MTLPILILLAVHPTTISKVPPTQTKLDAISDRCKTPHEWLIHERGKEVRVESTPDASYPKIECLMRELMSSNMDIELEFIGNQQVSPK